MLRNKAVNIACSKDKTNGLCWTFSCIYCILARYGGTIDSVLSCYLVGYVFFALAVNTSDFYEWMAPITEQTIGKLYLCIWKTEIFFSVAMFLVLLLLGVLKFRSYFSFVTQVIKQQRSNQYNMITKIKKKNEKRKCFRNGMGFLKLYSLLLSRNTNYC